MRLIQTRFTIDSESVIRGANHEDDHIHGSKISEIANLRTEKNDRSATVKQTQPVHRLKTNHFGKVKPKYDLEDVEKPLSEVLRPMTEADNAVWNDRANLEIILNSGVTPNFLCNQYAEGHKWQLTRMAHNLQMSAFNSRQATAFVTNRFLRSAITASATNFIVCDIKIPTTSESPIKGFDDSRVTECFRQKVRNANLTEFTRQFSDFIRLADYFELYSTSPEGLRGGCTLSQTREHRETKMIAIREFKRGIQEGFTLSLHLKTLSQTDLDDRVNKMLSLAEIDKDGNSKAAKVTTEKLKSRIVTKGEEIKINSLYKRESTFTIDKSLIDESKFYNESLQEANEGVRQVNEGVREVI